MLTGCVPKVPKEALSLRPENLEFRQKQSKRFETKDEKQIITAAASLLQDMGFQIDESEVPLGVIVASKQASAEDTGQIVGAIVVGVLFGTPVVYDKEQKIRASLVTRPINNQITLRVTFQRTVWNSEGHVARLEAVEDPQLYQDFFNRLSKAVFLQANNI